MPGFLVHGNFHEWSLPLIISNGVWSIWILKISLLSRNSAFPMTGSEVRAVPFKREVQKKVHQKFVHGPMYVVERWKHHKIKENVMPTELLTFGCLYSSHSIYVWSPWKNNQVYGKYMIKHLYTGIAWRNLQYLSPLLQLGRMIVLTRNLPACGYKVSSSPPWIRSVLCFTHVMSWISLSKILDRHLIPLFT